MLEDVGYPVVPNINVKNPAFVVPFMESHGFSTSIFAHHCRVRKGTDDDRCRGLPEAPQTKQVQQREPLFCAEVFTKPRLRKIFVRNMYDV